MAHTDSSFADMLLTLSMLPDRTELAQVLSTAEYHALLRKCAGNPGTLLGRDIGYLMSALACSEEEAYRICMLLSRTIPLSFHLEQMDSSGISILTLHDEIFADGPISETAPAAMYACGNTELLTAEKIGVFGISGVKLPVGADESITALVSFCKNAGYAMLSGSEAGACALAERRMLDAGGNLICVTAGDMKSIIYAPGYAEAIADERCLVLSPIHPEALYTVSHAKLRNQAAFDMCKASFVFTTDCKRYEPEAVRKKLSNGFIYALDVEKPEGNRTLISRGAEPFRVLDAKLLGEMQNTWYTNSGIQLSFF